MLARLVLPAVEPTVDFDFVKAYYARVSDRLHGRVTRLLLTPLLAAFTRLIGQDPYIRYLSSFRYALSGEFAVKADLAERMRLPCDWGLEIVTLFEALRHRAAGRVCQVEIAERYDHKHQTLSADDPSRGLNRMARDVVKHLLRTLAAAGVNLSPGLLMSLLAAYQREAEDAGRDSYAVANINGLVFDRHGEERTIQVFTQALRAATEEFLADPLGPPLVPNWSRVWAGVPDAGARLLAAVAKRDASVRRAVAMRRSGSWRPISTGRFSTGRRYDFAPARPGARRAPAAAGAARPVQQQDAGGDGAARRRDRGRRPPRGGERRRGGRPAGDGGGVAPVEQAEGNRVRRVLGVDRGEARRGAPGGGAARPACGCGPSPRCRWTRWPRSPASPRSRPRSRCAASTTSRSWSRTRPGAIRLSTSGSTARRGAAACG